MKLLGKFVQTLEVDRDSFARTLKKFSSIFEKNSEEVL